MYLTLKYNKMNFNFSLVNNWNSKNQMVILKKQ